MFERMLRFFVENSRMNYTLFVLVFAVGIWSYNNTPKEIFPSFELDMISVKGSYSGASVDILDRMAVSEIEDNIKNLDSIDTITTVISPGSFTIILELKKGVNKYNESNKVKDAITLVKSNLPSDMDEPIVNVMERKRSLIDITLTSQKYSTDELKPFADRLESKLLGVEGVKDITIFGDSDKYYQILLDDKKIEALGISKSAVFDAISTISYIFPIGKIEGDKHYYLSTFNGAKTAKAFESTLIRVQNKNIYLKDIASIYKKYEDSSTLYSFNGQSAISLAVEQSEAADAIKIVQKIKKLLPEINKSNPDVKISIADDNSERILDRLNIVLSNIILGIILITILVMLLINFRMSFIIVIGIPTSFVLAALYIYLSGYTINMISLVGVLIAIGIVVDDAIVVSENIQQHIEEGYEPKEAAILGAKEMVKPVTMASITTLFSFLPILMISGTMGEVMKLIPIAISALIIASLIESFIFLPIHAAHTLKANAKVTSWEKANEIYNKILHFFMAWKKSFLITFIIFVPLLTFMAIKSSKFQMFPKFDATDVKISIKANENTKLEDAFKIVQAIEQDIMKQKDRFFVRSIDSVAGYRKDTGDNREDYPYVMYMTVELQKLKAANFLDKYVTPYLSLYYDNEGRTRTKNSREISSDLKDFIDEMDFKKRYNLSEIVVLERRVGPVKADIKIGLVSNDNEKIIAGINMLQKHIESIKGVKSLSNSLKFGVDEIKLKVNNYGEQLGIDEAFIGSFLSNMFLSKKKAVSFDDTDMLDIKIESLNKDDYETLKNVEIPLGDGTFVSLSQVAQFQVIKGFEQLIKDNAERNFYVFANVNPDIITATELLDEIQPTLDKIKQSGIKIILKGEAEKQQSLKHDMLLALGLTVILIMLSMLYLFNSFRETFILMSVIPFSLLGVLIGHKVMGLNLSMPSLIGALGLAGVVINDGIIMMTYLKKAKALSDVFYRATKRFRPIVLTTVTTLMGMCSLIFFPTGQAVIFQPIAIALGFGLLWGTILNLLYLPVIYSISHRLKGDK
ncbi:efflux RND transporter permease subunit [Halarcobacter ebronensis]|uniref:Acriflavin resistance protein n=1 Tax=Halarcobacter ebronensis TaxID=1462615 RepID=A0A4Q1ATU1_9BACT|nr:efflux RND transporter permease subunit [Halarcobacter ebronensis]QKF81252.1 RND family efflux system, inner membrane transporter, AcrB family [Halarcobacter ebronensis]RXK04818.1 acriflavin resistance protein [Halarcobacter ebronensis]